MNLKKIQNVDLINKKVLLRVDFNVATENNKLKEKYKIEICRETLRYILRQKGARVVLVSHLGRPGVEKIQGTDQEKHHRFSFRPLLGELEKILGVKIKFIPTADPNVIKKALSEMENSQIALLENIRFYSEEEENDQDFSRKLARNFDVFVNEAFSVCHRRHASVVGISEFLPSLAGLRLQNEIKNLDKAKNNPKHPAVAVIGGAKIKTKLPLIRNLGKNYDHILVGGKVAIEALEQKIDFDSKVILPYDFAKRQMDIGDETIFEFQKIIKKAKTIVWNGPLGVFEKPPFNIGTREILEAIVKSRAFTVVGGGESVQVLEENGALDKISFVSTGGGAMLAYLAGEEMPGLGALEIVKGQGWTGLLSYI